ncbi:MAG: DUF268 domain-containing protein [Paludibacter sp.]
MKKTIESIKFFFKLFGINLFVFKNSIKGIPFYLNDLRNLKKHKAGNTDFIFGRNFPQFSDRFTNSGVMSGHYFHQDLYVARKIYENNPINHIDIGSRTDGFVAHLAVFREVEIVDIRPQISKTKNIIFRQADLMQLPANMINAYSSVSSLHAIEHFGLGRYGDPIDYFGHEKAIKNITQMLTVGGLFYFSVPIGLQRIEFNAHRVFSIDYLLNFFSPNFELLSFSYVDDKGDLHENITLTEDKISNNLGCSFGCGIFEWKKNR